MFCNKSHKLSFGVLSFESSKPLELIFAYVWAPALMLFCDHHHYYVIFVDHDTQCTWLYLLKKMFDVTFVFESFKRLIEIFFSNLSLLFILLVVMNILDFIPFLLNMVFNISSLQPPSPLHAPYYDDIVERHYLSWKQY